MRRLKGFWNRITGKDMLQSTQQQVIKLQMELRSEQRRAQSAESKAKSLSAELDGLYSGEVLADISPLRAKKILSLALSDYADRMSGKEFYELMRDTLYMSDREIIFAGFPLEKMLGDPVVTIAYHTTGEVQHFYEGREEEALNCFQQEMHYCGINAVGYQIAEGHDQIRKQFRNAVLNEIGYSAEEVREKEDNDDMEMEMEM